MIPEDVINDYLTGLFGRSEPGDIMHHLLVAASKPGAQSGPLGIPELESTLYAIAPDDSVDTDEFIGKTILSAVAGTQQSGAEIQFIGLAMEAHIVALDGNEVTENQARLMRGERRLQEHPAAVEVTRLYAACRGGLARRWIGTHFLTGPRAGVVDGPLLRVGALSPDEKGKHQFLIRTAVGIQR